MRIAELAEQLQPYVMGWIQTVLAAPSGIGALAGAPSPHSLNSAHHSSTLADSQAPQFLKLDGSRQLTGNLAVATGATVDGVDISAHAASPSAHHEPVTLGSGGLSAYLGLAGQVLTLSTIDHGLLSGKSDDDHPQYGALAQNEIVTGAWDFQAPLDTYTILPAATDTYDLGSPTKLWRAGYLSELDTVLFAQNTITLSGARQVWGHNCGTLAADASAAAATVDFGQAMTAGDFVELRGYLQVEYMLVGSLASGTVYNVTRNLDGSGANAWAKGAPYLVLGQSGDHRIEIDAGGPYLRILRQGATYATATEPVRLGNMRGAFGVGSSDYFGIGVGDYSGGNYLKYETNGGFEIKSGGGKLALDSTGLTLSAENAATSSVKWMNASTGKTAATMVGYEVDAGRNWLYIASKSPGYGSGYESGISIEAWRGDPSSIPIQGASILVSAVNDRVSIEHGHFVAWHGVHVGGASDPGTDNLIVDGHSYVNGKRYQYLDGAWREGWLVYLLSPCWTNPGWDGDTKSAGTYPIDTSSGGIPVGVKACYVRLSIKGAAAGASYWAGCSYPDADEPSVLAHSSVANQWFDAAGWVKCDSSGDFDMIINGQSVEIYLEIHGYAV